MDEAPAPAVIKKSDYDYDDILSKYTSSPKLNRMDHENLGMYNMIKWNIRLNIKF